MASLVFTDTETPTAAFLLTGDDKRETVVDLAAGTGTQTWPWVIGEDVPALPFRLAIRRSAGP